MPAHDRVHPRGRCQRCGERPVGTVDGPRCRNCWYRVEVER